MGDRMAYILVSKQLLADVFQMPQGARIGHVTEDKRDPERLIRVYVRHDALREVPANEPIPQIVTDYRLKVADDGTAEGEAHWLDLGGAIVRWPVGRLPVLEPR
jgi:hypothetical protein